ncbi:MAG: hypothetical protein ACE5K9_11720 [Candidatus Methylomirabilales bacterium]
MRKRMVLGITVLAYVLAGCAGPRWARSVIQQGEKLCRQKRLQGALSTHVEEARCKAEQIRPVLAEEDYPHMDVINLWLAYELAFAKQIDEGTLSEEDGELLLGKVRLTLNRKIMAREQARGRALPEDGP